MKKKIETGEFIGLVGGWVGLSWVELVFMAYQPL